MKTNPMRSITRLGRARSIEQFVDRYYKPPTCQYPDEEIFRKEMLKNCKEEFKSKKTCVIPVESSLIGQPVQYHKNFGFLHDWISRKLSRRVKRDSASSEIRAQKKLTGFVDTHIWKKVVKCDICGCDYGYTNTGHYERQEYRCKDCGITFIHDLSEDIQKSIVKNVSEYFDKCSERQLLDEKYREPVRCNQCFVEYDKKWKSEVAIERNKDALYKKVLRQIKEKLDNFRYWAKIFLA